MLLWEVSASLQGFSGEVQKDRGILKHLSVRQDFPCNMSITELCIPACFVWSLQTTACLPNCWDHLQKFVPNTMGSHQKRNTPWPLVFRRPYRFSLCVVNTEFPPIFPRLILVYTFYDWIEPNINANHGCAPIPLFIPTFPGPANLAEKAEKSPPKKEVNRRMRQVGVLDMM